MKANNFCPPIGNALKRFNAFVLFVSFSTAFISSFSSSVIVAIVPNQKIKKQQTNKKTTRLSGPCCTNIKKTIRNVPAAIGNAGVVGLVGAAIGFGAAGVGEEEKNKRKEKERQKHKHIL